MEPTAAPDSPLASTASRPGLDDVAVSLGTRVRLHRLFDDALAIVGRAKREALSHFGK